MENLKTAITFNSEDTISKVIAKMNKEKAHEVVVFDNKEYLGILSSDKLIKKNISEPDKTKLSQLKTIIDKVEPFESIDAEEIIKSVLINNYKSAPIRKDKKIFFLTKLEMLNLVDKNLLKDKTASHVMVFPDIVSSGDSLSVAKSIMRDSHSNRVVILEEGKAIGILDPLDVLNSFITRTRTKRGDVSGEKLKIGGISASSRAIMQKNFLKVTPDKKLSEVVKKMIEQKKDTVIVEDNGKLLGMITPRHILKLVSKQVEGVYVQITGIQDEDSFIKSLVDDEINQEIRKLGKIVNIDYLTIHVRKRRATGNRTKYSVKAKLITNIGFFHSNDYAWDLTQAVRGILKKLEKELVKKKGKMLHKDKTLVRHR